MKVSKEYDEKIKELKNKIVARNKMIEYIKAISIERGKEILELKDKLSVYVCKNHTED